MDSDAIVTAANTAESLPNTPPVNRNGTAIRYAKP